MDDMDKESCVVRIVHLDDSFTETALKSFISLKCQPQGDIIKIYLKRNELNIFFGYIIFEHSYDASKTVGLLNEYVHISNKLEVELIGPNLLYRKYIANPSGDSGKAGGSKYIPPSMRDGATNRRGSYSIRIANLTDSTTATDLKELIEELVKPFGQLKKVDLAKDKQTGLCQGFAYIHFKFRNDAAKAVFTLNGYYYNNLYLNVDWSKPNQ